jgi:hypothetical protein
VRHTHSTVRRALALAALAAFMVLPVWLVGSPPSGALLPPVSGCGYTFGPNGVLGAAGTEYFSFVLNPANPAQQCTVSVSFTAAIAPNAGGSYTNIDNNPLHATESVSFVAGRLPPVLVVGWAGLHCADPALPGSLTVTAAGQSTAAAIGVPQSCGPPGATHSSLRPQNAPLLSIVAIAPTANNGGYYTIDQVGNITSAGNAPGYGTYQAESFAPVVGIVNVPGANGSWVVAADGGVFSYGAAVFYGSLGGVHLNAPIVGMAPTPSGHGYWLVGADGGVFAFGDAQFYMSLGGTALNAPIVGLAPTPSGHGYWLVGADGGVFTFGDAAFAGSLGSVALNARIIGIAAGPHGGYWLVGADGGVFTFGGVPFEGSMGAKPLNAQVAGMAVTSTGNGYWLVGSDGGIFTFGDADFFGANPITPWGATAG